MTIDKAYILDEIRRLAQANGGKPLGRAAFKKQAGVRESEWYGRYWPRWSDAVIEAGFVPNRYNSALPEDQLLQQYADFVQGLGRIPTTGELRLHGRNTTSFPSHTIWTNRFGTKAELVRRVEQFCNSRVGYETVASLCASYVAAVPSRHEQVPDRDKRVYGFVYLMKSGRNYKIGKTNAVGRREYELRIQLPEPIRTIHTIQTDDPDGIEDYWHRRFAAKRGNGEWFQLDAQDVAVFKSRNVM